MVLAQDQAQASQTEALSAEIKRVADAKAAEIKYQKDLAQYQQDLVTWEKEKASVEAENKAIIAAETKRRADEKTAYTKAENIRVAELNKAEDIRVAELKAKDDKLVATAVSFVKADQKEKADLALKAETKRLADLAVKEEKQRAKQEVIDKNKAFFDSGKRFYGGKEIHHAKLQGVPTQEGEIKYYDGGKFTLSYYERAGKQMGITTEQARKVSDAGRLSQSGKQRDMVLRSFQDPTGGLEAQYKEHRRLAAKTTASAYGAIAVKKAQASGTNTATDIYGSKSLVGTNVKAPQGSYAEQIETARRTQRTIDLRAGNVGFATALLEPVTDNTYTNTSGKVDALTLTKTFLTERGYDLNNLDAVPDSVFTTPTKYVKARKQTTSNAPMGDLTKLIPAQPTMYEKKKVGEVQVGPTLNKYYKTVPNAELVKRTEARERLESIKPVTPVQGSIQKPMQGPVQETSKVQWSVTYDVPTKIPTISGSTIVPMPVTKTFESKDKADSFVKGLESRNTQPIKSDNEFVNAMRYSDLVDAGEVKHPRDTPSLGDDLLYYSSAGLRPIYNLGLTGYNLAQDKQTAIKPTTLESFAGGLIESAQHTITGGQSGRPIQQTMGETWNHFMSDPVRSLVEIPAEVGITLVGGKAIQGASKAGLLAKESLKASARTPQVVKTVIQTGEKIDFKVKMLNPIAKKNYQKTEEIAKDLYSKYPNKSSYNVDMIDSKTFLVTAGTETVPVKTPAIIVRYGKKGLLKGEKESSFYTEYEASVHPIKSVKVQGVMEKNLMEGVKQTGKYEYTIPATPKNMQTLSSERITNAIKPVGYEVSEKTSMLSPEMRYATMSVVEDPVIQKTNLTVLGETQAGKWYVTPRDKIFSKDNDTFYKKNPFTNKKLPEETIPKPVGTILKNKSITSQSNNTLKDFARKSAAKTTQRYLPNVVVATNEVIQTRYAPTKELTGLSTSVIPVIETRSVSLTSTKTAAIQDTVQSLKTQTELKSRVQTKVKTRQRTSQVARSRLSLVSPLRPVSPTMTKTKTQRYTPVLVSVKITQKRQTKRRTPQKRKDFLGNSRTDSIIGLFKRTEVITGDKKTAKQLKKDKKYKEKKSRKIKSKKKTLNVF